jgi:hypothetical protein
MDCNEIKAFKDFWTINKNDFFENYLLEYHNRHDEEVQILYLLFTHINRHYTIFTVSFQEYKYILPTNLNVFYIIVTSLKVAATIIT